MLCALDGGRLIVLMLCTYVTCKINLFHFIVSLFVLFIHETSYKHKCYGAEVIFVTFYLFVSLEFLDGKQNFAPNVWQAVLANFSV